MPLTTVGKGATSTDTTATRRKAVGESHRTGHGRTRRVQKGDVDMATQNLWRFCKQCQGMWYSGNPTLGHCPAGGGHDIGATDYTLTHDAPGPGQQAGWRWCNACQGLFYGQFPTSGHCPANGGGHDFTGSANYSISVNVSDPSLQSNWRWCNKCEGLFFAGHSTTGHCPAGGGHDYSGSGNYGIPS